MMKGKKKRNLIVKIWRIRLRTKMGNTRQIDTGIGIITGGVIGWFHHKWYIWLLLFLILIFWGYIDSSND